MSRSIAEQFAEMPREDMLDALSALEPEQILALLDDWRWWARPEQMMPALELWLTWYIETGRGFGKTRTASEAVHEIVEKGYCQFGALVHRTAGDCREILVEGKSGIMATARKGRLPNYEPSKRRITFHNGAIMSTFSAEEPDQLRGPEFDLVVGDEFATWKGIVGVDGLTAFDNARFAARGTANPTGPKTILMTTPKRVKAVKQMHEDARDPSKKIIITKGSLRDNISNLDPSYVQAILSKYAGTALGLQEIDGILSKTVEGAIFTELLFNTTRITDLQDLPELASTCVAVDPSVGDGSGDECGISVQALSAGPLHTEFSHGGLSVIRNVRHGYVLDDCSMSGPPDAWAQRVVETCDKWLTTTVVVEGNQGGEMVRPILRALNPSLRVKIVHARIGKEARAQPIAALFAQNRWHLVGVFGEMEDQSTTWIPGSGKKSPDRMDAMVWGATHLEPPREVKHQYASVAQYSKGIG